MKYLRHIALLLVAGASMVMAQPSVSNGGVVNIASYAPVGLPNSSIAQGSMFAVFGSNIGPSTLQQVSSFPLPQALGGTSIQVTVGGTTVNAYMIYTSASQVAAIMPSNTPTGSGMLTLTYNSQKASVVAVQVTGGSFGIFTQNSQGTGPGSIADSNNNVFGLTSAALPGDEAVIWGTGLGPVSGNEAGGALPGDMPNLPVHVLVGGIDAQIVYRGRSGCCSGIDQIFFTVPSGVSGCYVPVAVQIGNTISNFPTMSIGANGSRTCSDASGISSNLLTQAQQQGSLSLGFVGLTRDQSTSTGLPPPLGTGQPTVTTTDSGSGDFMKYTYQQFTTAANPLQSTTFGACTVYTFKGNSGSTQTPTGTATGLNAGAALTVNGPNGSKQLTPLTGANIVGLYDATLGGGTPPNNTPLYLSQGSYTVTGPGGPDVGAFTANLNVPQPLNWTNESSITTVTRANGQLITWTGGAAGSTVQIVGSSFVFGSNPNGSDSVGATFSCTAQQSALQFTIPAPVLLSLPASIAMSIGGISFPTGSLAVENVVTGTFTAPGIDYGFTSSNVEISEPVTYQ
jgi:uncharacterized protein (TIGR03437 family)